MSLIISKVGEGALNSVLEAGLACDFDRMLFWSVSREGKVYGGVGLNHILLGLTGVTGRLLIFVGPEEMVRRDLGDQSDQVFTLRSENCIGKAIESEIRAAIPDWLGHTKVRYGLASHGPIECYVIEVVWDSNVVSGYRFHAERFSTPKARSVAERVPSDFSKDLPEDVICQILERRSARDCSAIELRLPSSEVSSALGLKPGGLYLSAEAKACFGNNENMPTVVYHRHVDRKILPRLEDLTDRKSLAHVKPLSSMTQGVEEDRVRLDGLAVPLKKTLDHYAYRLAGNIFEALDSVAEVFVDPVEVFRDGDRQPHGFNPSKWIGAVQELVVNAFAHGAWPSGKDSTRNDKASWTFAQAVSIIHAGNRVEVINRKPTEIQLEGRRETGTLFPGNLGPIHSVLKDIGLATGRNRGIITARRELQSARAVAPIFIRDVHHFRVVMPLGNEFPTALLDPEHSHLGSTALSLNFTLRLACLLGEVDEMTVSSALGIPLDVAAITLGKAAERRLLEKSNFKPPNPFHFLHYPLNRPTFRLTDETAVREFLIGNCDDLIPIGVPSIMSPKGIYALSAMGLGRLGQKDFENAIWNIFKREGVFADKIDAVAQTFIDEARPHREQYLGRHNR